MIPNPMRYKRVSPSINMHSLYIYFVILNIILKTYDATALGPASPPASALPSPPTLALSPSAGLPPPPSQLVAISLHHQHHQQQQQVNNHHNQQQQQQQQAKKGAQTWQNQNLHKLSKYLNVKQQEFIKRHPGSLVAVARALKMAITECQYQMRHEPWDCPIHGFSIKPTEVFGMLISRSFKETSFIQSLLSSAIAHSVTRACTESTISTCSRKLSHNGPSEDIEFGRMFAKNFTELGYDYSPASVVAGGGAGPSTSSGSSSSMVATGSLGSSGAALGGGGGSSTNNLIEQQNQIHHNQVNHDNNQLQQQPYWKEKRLRSMINAHNDEVGRLRVLEGMKRECKCHGLSGTCTLETCWTKLPPFREVANRIHDSLDKALRVEMYVAHTGGNLATNRYKSLTSSSGVSSSSLSSPTNTITKKSNKKRSSSSQPASSLNSLGRSSPAIKSSIRSSEFGGGGGGSRLQAFHQDTMNNVVSSANIGPNPTDMNLIDRQSLREFSSNQANLFNQQPMTSQNTTVVKKRPVARSIGITASTITPGKFDLLYAEESPDFCIPSERYNIKGTKGRLCSENPTASNSCERLCCGRGYKTEIREEKYKCECKFQLCCKLQCNTCTRRKILHKCL